MCATQRHTQQEPKYRALLRITAQVLESARQVVKKAAKTKGVDVLGGLAIEPLRQQIAAYCDLGEKVMDQTRRRVLDGEQVPPDEKVYSIFADHTHLIKRGKQRTPVEFGHKVFLAESAQGLITDYRVLDGNPADTIQVQASLDRHRQVFQCPPELYAGDRGFYSAENVHTCQQAGVSHVCIPQRGGQKTAEQETLEHSRAFKQGQRFRVGIEGRISVLFRGRGMKRCRAKGRVRFEVLGGAAVLANNLRRIAELLRNRKPARHAKAAGLVPHGSHSPCIQGRGAFRVRPSPPFPDALGQPRSIGPPEFLRHAPPSVAEAAQAIHLYK
jgi:transposase, IS5 family